MAQGHLQIGITQDGHVGMGVPYPEGVLGPEEFHYFKFSVEQAKSIGETFLKEARDLQELIDSGELNEHSCAHGS
jgi:hypothetical protein